MLCFSDRQRHLYFSKAIFNLIKIKISKYQLKDYSENVTFIQEMQ
jgi:hypothetical protein